MSTDTSPWFVWVYLCDRAYGGPEEGGWWYDCGEPVMPGHWAWNKVWHFCALKGHERQAEAFCRDAQEYLDLTINKDRRSINEIDSEGLFRAVISQEQPAPFPKFKPHYE